MRAGIRPRTDVTAAMAGGGERRPAGAGRYTLARRPAMTSRFTVRRVFVRFGPPIPRRVVPFLSGRLQIGSADPAANRWSSRPWGRLDLVHELPVHQGRLNNHHVLGNLPLLPRANSGSFREHLLVTLRHKSRFCNGNTAGERRKCLAHMRQDSREFGGITRVTRRFDSSSEAVEDVREFDSRPVSRFRCSPGFEIVAVAATIRSGGAWSSPRSK